MAVGLTELKAGESLERERDVLRVAMRLLQERLPAGWGMTEARGLAAGATKADLLVTVAAPDGSSVVVAVDCRRLLIMRDAAAVIAAVKQLAAALDRDAMPMVAARYLAPPVRARLEEAGVGYVDATGNLRLVADRPALFLSDHGEDRDPWRGPGRPRGTLKGVPAARVVRALADFTPPMSVPELIRRSDASTGAAYRVVRFLQEQDLITRGQDGRVESVDWRAMLQRWSQDAVSATDTPHRYLQPRGLQAVQDALTSSVDVPYAMTGTLAAQRWAPYAPPRLAMIYVDDPGAAARAWGLRVVDTGANVLLAVPESEVVYQRAFEVDGVRLAAPSQVAVDLLTGPGRSPSEAEYLLDWMQAHESQWRR